MKRRDARRHFADPRAPSEFEFHVVETICHWSWPIEQLRFVIRAKVDFRYPGEMADEDEAREAFAICGRIREKLLPMISAED